MVVAAVIELLGRIEPNGRSGLVQPPAYKINRLAKLNKLIWLLAEINSKELF